MLPAPSVGGTDFGGSRFKVYQTCPKKYYWSYKYGETGLVSRESGLGMELGSALHAALDTYYKEYHTSTLSERIVHATHAGYAYINGCPFEDKEAMNDLFSKGLAAYFLHWDNPETDLSPLMCEHPFEQKVGEYTHTGRFDMVGYWRGELVVIDHKTTSENWDAFFKKWRLDFSLMGYLHHARTIYPEQPVHLLINGIRRTKHKEVRFEFQRDIIFFTNEELNEWERTFIQIRQDIDRREQDERMIWEKNGASCVSVYGSCQFRDLCINTSPDQVTALAATLFKRRE